VSNLVEFYFLEELGWILVDSKMKMLRKSKTNGWVTFGGLILELGNNW